MITIKIKKLVIWNQINVASEEKVRLMAMRNTQDPYEREVNGDEEPNECRGPGIEKPNEC